MTMREFFLLVDGYNRVRHREDIRHRTLCFVIAKPHLKDQNATIFEFMPLDGDPSPEEIQKMQEENFEKEMIQARKDKDQVMAAFNNLSNARV